MAYDVNTLKNRAQCLEAKKSLELELASYQNRDQNLAYQDLRADAAEESAATRLTTATNTVENMTRELARTDLSPKDRRTYQARLITARAQKELLELRADDEEGAADFLAQVDSDQIDQQVALLTRAIGDVQARHDALPA